MTHTEKAHENRVRLLAARMGCVLSRSRVRDTRAPSYAKYTLYEKDIPDIPVEENLTLAEAEAFFANGVPDWLTRTRAVAEPRARIERRQQLAAAVEAKAVADEMWRALTYAENHGRLS